MENQIMAEHLSFHYTDEEGKAVSPEILKDLSLTFQPGSFVAVSYTHLTLPTTSRV